MIDYTKESIFVQHHHIMAQQPNIATIESRVALWNAAEEQLGVASTSLLLANTALGPGWKDNNGGLFLPAADDARRAIDEWWRAIAGTAPQQALGKIVSNLRTAREVVERNLALTIAERDKIAALAAQAASAGVPTDQLVTAANQGSGYSSGWGTDAGFFNSHLTQHYQEIERLQVEAGLAMNALETAYSEALQPMRDATSGREFPISPFGGGEIAPDGPAGGYGGGGPGGFAMPGSVEVPIGADPALPEGVVPAAATLPSDPAVPGAGGPDLAALTGAGGPDAGLGPAGLDQAATPSLSGVAGALAPTLPPSVPPSLGGVATPGAPTPSPFLPPVLPPGGIASPGSVISPGGIASPGGVGGGARGIGGSGLPGLGVGGVGSTSIPQAAVPVSAAGRGIAGGAPSATAPQLSGAPTTVSPAGGAVPPMMPPPMMGGAGAGQGGGRPGSGAARRPPAGRGPTPTPTPGLPALLSGKAGRLTTGATPLRTRPSTVEREASPLAVGVVDEDLWRVDEAAPRSRAGQVPL
jgi:hypothetical protein